MPTPRRGTGGNQNHSRGRKGKGNLQIIEWAGTYRTLDGGQAGYYFGTGSGWEGWDPPPFPAIMCWGDVSGAWVLILKPNCLGLNLSSPTYLNDIPDPFPHLCNRRNDMLVS